MSKFKEITREREENNNNNNNNNLVQSRFLDWFFDFFENRQ
jgi:hypothetical protein